MNLICFKNKILHYVLASDGFCISVVTGATSLTIHWCQRLADAFSVFGKYGLIELRRQGNLVDHMVSMHDMELAVHGL